MEASDVEEAPVAPSGPEVLGEGPSLIDLVRGTLGHPQAPIRALAVVVLGWIVVMGRLIVMRQHRIGTFDFDTGLNDQYIWQLAHFRQANTVRGLTFLGNHAYYALVLFIPLVWLGGTVSTWDLLHTIALATAAFPLFFLARDKLGRPWLAAGLGLVWLGQPTVQWFVHEGFHPENFALPFLFGTYLFGERWIVERRAGAVSSRTRWGLVACFVLTITWKEDLALALLGMGLWWLIRRQWRLGLRVAGTAAAYFVIVAVILLPRFAGGSVFAGAYDLGKTPTEIARNVLAHPSRLTDKLDQNDALGYGRGLTQSYGFVPLLSPGTLLIGLPQATIDIISASNFTWDLKFHYQSIPMGALAISTVEGVVILHRRRRWLGEAGLAIALTAALVSTRWYGPTPLSVKYRAGYWPLQAGPTLPLREAVRDRIPGSDGVSADYLMVPQLTHRQVVYTFPNPWRSSNYGVKPDAIGDPAAVRWLTVERGLLNPRDTGLLASIEASGEFRTVVDQQGVLLLQRVRPPGGGTAPIADPPG